MLSPDQLRQYARIRAGSALIDAAARGRVAVRGSDRQSFLQALLTNDVASLGPGTGCYAALLTPLGRMVTDLRVFELGEVMLLEVPRAVKDALMARLDQLIFSEDVQLLDLSDVLGCVSVQGPGAMAAVEQALAGGPGGGASGLAAELASWSAFQNRQIELGGQAGILARVDEFGLPGVLIFAPPAVLPSVAAAIAAAGAMVPDDEVVETLRVESGTPLFLVDMTDDTIPLEAGIEARAISSTKGCYPGQEVIVRIRDRGHGRIVRKLVGLAIDGDVEPTPGEKLLADAKDVGHVTSAAYSPTLGRPIALGYVHRDHIAAGSRLTVAHGDTILPATVTELPFV